MVIFFFASAAASSAYLTVSESFPLEIRALAIAVFYAFGTALGGIVGPAFFGRLIDTHQRSEVFSGYLVGSGLMLAAAVIAAIWGVDAERNRWRAWPTPLSSVADGRANKKRAVRSPRVSQLAISRSAVAAQNAFFQPPRVGDLRQRQTLAHRLLALAQHRIQLVDLAVVAERNHRDHVDVARQRECRAERVRVEAAHLMRGKSERMRLQYQRHRGGARVVRRAAIHFALAGQRVRGHRDQHRRAAHSSPG